MPRTALQGDGSTHHDPYTKPGRSINDGRQFFCDGRPVCILPSPHLRFDVTRQRSFREMDNAGFRRRRLFHEAADMQAILPDVRRDQSLSRS